MSLPFEGIPGLPVIGSVAVTSLPPITIPPVTGSVAVTNFPAVQSVSGVVGVSNFPATQPVSGTVAATQSGTWSVGRTWTLLNTTDSVNVGNFPATQAVTQSGVWHVELDPGANVIGKVQQSGAWSVDQGAPNGIGSAWPVELTDGTDTMNINPDGSINVANVTSVVSNTANLTNITSSTSSQTVLTANAARKGFILFNDSTANCFIAFAATTTTSAFSIFLNPTMTYQNEAIIYTGVMSAIWSAANGFLRVTELT